MRRVIASKFSLGCGEMPARGAARGAAGLVGVKIAAADADCRADCGLGTQEQYDALDSNHMQ